MFSDEKVASQNFLDKRIWKSSWWWWWINPNRYPETQKSVFKKRLHNGKPNITSSKKHENKENINEGKRLKIVTN